MRCITPQITWNNRDPVLSIDFDPSSNVSKDGYYRLATGGADSHLLIWHLKHPDTLKPELVCVTDLTRHVKAVNVVRFSPCGNFIASGDDEAYVYIWKNESKSETEETWLVDKILRRHLEDVADLCWSSDASFLFTASVDNSAIMWDLKKNTPLHIWSEHNGLVEGIAFDPKGELAATMATDRLLRVFNTKTAKLTTKASKYPDSWLPQLVETHQKKANEVPTPVESGVENGEAIPVAPKSAAPISRLFHDDTLRTFCRRLSFSPKGELLIVPGGILPLNDTTTKEKKSPSPVVVPSTPTSAAVLSTPTHTPASETSDSAAASASKKLKKPALGEKEMEVSNNAVIIFCQNSYTTPCGVIPTGSSYSIATRFSPLYYQRGDSSDFTYDTEFANSTKKSERLISCVGKVESSKKGKRAFMDTPYKLVFAIATNNSVIIGDTESCQPRAVVRNIHFTRMSDLTWSSDGKVLLVSSTDGYCSIISFADQELGIPIEASTILEEPSPTSFPILPEVKKIPKEKKTPGPKKEKKSNNAAVPAGSEPISGPETPARTATVAGEITSSPSGMEVQGKKVNDRKKKASEIKLLNIFKKMQVLKEQAEALKPQVDPDALPDAEPDILISISPIAKENNPAIEQQETPIPNDDDPDSDKSTPKPKPAQKNTLDKWIIKTPKSAENLATLKPVKEELRTPAQVRRVLGLTPAEYQPVVHLQNSTISSVDLIIEKVVGDSRITSAEIEELKHAPIIIDLEPESCESGSTIVGTASPAVIERDMPKLTEFWKDAPPIPAAAEKYLHTADSPAQRNLTVTKLCGIDITQKENENSRKTDADEGDTNDKAEEIIADKSEAKEGNTGATEKLGVKRPATSPLSSTQKKQPRRVQLITLSAPSDKSN